MVYGWPRPFWVLLERTSPPRRAAPAELICPAIPGMVAFPVKSMEMAEASGTPGMGGAKPLARVLEPLKPNFVSFTAEAERTWLRLINAFCGTAVTRNRLPLTDVPSMGELETPWSR